MMKESKTIKQSTTIAATPQQVYKTLMNSKQHGQFTGEKAKIANNIGGKFNCYGNYITGINLELQPGKKIIQAWRCRDWPKGVYSIVTFALAKTGGSKTKLNFTQTGVPYDDYEDKCAGWKTHYWKPLQAYFKKDK